MVYISSPENTNPKSKSSFILILFCGKIKSNTCPHDTKENKKNCKWTFVLSQNGQGTYYRDLSFDDENNKMWNQTRWINYTYKHRTLNFQLVKCLVVLKHSYTRKSEHNLRNVVIYHCGPLKGKPWTYIPRSLQVTTVCFPKTWLNYSWTCTHCINF